MTPASSIPPVSNQILTQQTVLELARKAGFTEAGVVSLPHDKTAEDAARFTGFIEKGFAGTMAYLERRDDAGQLIRSRIDLPFPWARSIIVCIASYNADAPLSTTPAQPGAGWIARYAWSSRKDDRDVVRPSDYHKVLLKRLRTVEDELHSAFGPFESRAYVDTGPIVERNAARAAGLGWTGKNTCLIHPRTGSWNFLAVILTSLELRPEQAPLVVPDRCGTCRRCLDACPTNALIAPYRMDATRCISYLTIEHRGDIATDLMPGMGRQVFGCDICQDVCPWNRKAPIGTAVPELAPREALINPDLDWLASLEEQDFERLFNGSPIRRTGFHGFRRNLAIAMGNSGLTRFLPRLAFWAADDSSANALSQDAAASQKHLALRNAARWASNQIMAIQKSITPD
jgi:epoxyqueuosine reductase